MLERDTGKQSPGKLASIKKSHNVKYNSIMSKKEIEENIIKFYEEMQVLCEKHQVYVNSLKHTSNSKQHIMQIVVKSRRLKFGKIQPVWDSSIFTTKVKEDKEIDTD